MHALVPGGPSLDVETVLSSWVDLGTGTPTPGTTTGDFAVANIGQLKALWNGMPYGVQKLNRP